MSLSSEKQEAIQELSAIVDESAIANQVAPSAKVKKLPGRPKKNGGLHKGYQRLAIAPEPIPEPQPSPAAPEALQGPAIESADDLDGVEFEMADQGIEAILDMPFIFLRKRTKYPGFRLDDATKASCTPLAAQSLKDVMPKLDPKWAAPIALLTTLGTILAKQSMDYSEWLESQHASTRAPGPITNSNVTTGADQFA